MLVPQRHSGNIYAGFGRVARIAFFCFSYPKLRPWHLFIDPKWTQLRWMSSLSTQLWRTTSPSCRVAGLPPGYGCRPPTTATLEGGGVDIIVDMPLDRTYPCRLCVFLCVVATCLVCSCRPCFNACIRVQQHHVKNNTIAPQPYIYISQNNQSYIPILHTQSYTGCRCIGLKACPPQ